MTTWRVLFTGHLPGNENMAIDDALLRSVANGGPPTLRFYGWEPPAISIGYFQKINEELDVDACKSLGVDVIRRPTGGRAVLHDVEVTYSLVIPEDNELIPKGITESYKSISEGMVRGFSKIGLQAQMVSLSDKKAENRANGRSTRAGSKKYNVTVEMPDTRGSSVVCFDAPSWYEVTVDGKKVVGSAQMRRKGVLLQHGSIPLELDADKLFACMRLPSEAVRDRLKQSFLSKATSIREALGRSVTFMEVAEAVRDGMAETFNVRMVEGSLTEAEKADAKQLALLKYAQATDEVGDRMSK